MKLPRNAKVFRGQLDAAPFAGVLFLLLIFLLLSSKLVFTPGVHIDLPVVSQTLPGALHSTLAVAVDAAGRYYYDARQTTPDELAEKLKVELQKAREPLTLEVQSDRAAQSESVYRLFSLAGEIGYTNILWVAHPQRLPIQAGRAPTP